MYVTHSHICTLMYMYILGKVTALGVLCGFALFCLFASFFPPSHLSFKNMYIIILGNAIANFTFIYLSYTTSVFIPYIVYSLPYAFTCRTLCENIMYMYNWEYIILPIYIEQAQYAIGTFNFTCVVFSNSVHIHMY